MTIAAAARRPALLIVEPDFLLRRTVAGVVRELALAEVHEATGVEAATRQLAEQPFEALLLALDDDGAAIELLRRLRRGALRSPPALPVAVTATACDAGLALRLKELDVKRVLLKPFKVKGVIDTIAGLCAAAADLPATGSAVAD
jgi:CheY-like chemotaxis protein